MIGTTSLGTLVVYLTANASQYQRVMHVVDAEHGAVMERMVKATKYAGIAVTGTLAAISTAAVYEFAKFEEAITDSLAIMGNVSDETRRQFEETARDIAKSSTTSATQVAEAYLFLASAGFDAEQSLKAIVSVEKFAVAGMFDLNRATTYLADAQSALGLRSENAATNMRNLTRVADALTKANILANASVEDFSIALTTKSANALRLVNKELEEGVAVLAAFAQQGIKSAAAGDALHQVIRDLQRASIKERETWDQFGLSIFDASGKMLHLADIISQLENALEPMNDEQRRATLMLLGFQDRSISATQALLGLSGTIRKFEAELKSAGGVTEELAEKRLKSVSAQFKIFYNNVKDSLITIGGELIPVLQALGFSFGNTKNTLEQLNKAYQDGLLTLAEFEKKTKDVNDEARKWAETTTELKNTIVALALTATTVFMDVVHGWKLIVTAAQLGLASYKSAVAVTMLGAVSLVENNIRIVVAAVNKAIGLINLMRKLQGDFSKPIEMVQFAGFDIAKELKQDIAEAAKDVVKFKQQLTDLIDKGRPSDEFLARWEELQRRLTFGEPATQLERVTKALNQFFGSMDKNEMSTQLVDSALSSFFRTIDLGAAPTARMTPELMKLRRTLQDPLSNVYAENVSELDDVMRQGVISGREYNEMLQQITATQNQFIKPLGGLSQGKVLNLTGDETVDAFVQNKNERTLLEKSFDDKLKAVDQYYDAQIKAQTGNNAEQIRLEQVRIDTLTQMSEAYNAQMTVLQNQHAQLMQGALSVKSMTGDPTVDQMTQLENELTLLEQGYNAKLAAEVAFYEQVKDVEEDAARESLARQQALENQYLANREVFQKKQMELLLTSASNTFGELAAVTKEAFGEQAGAYKAMFAISKAFAIADATLKFTQAASQVMADPSQLTIYQKFAAYAAMAAHGASIISNMASIALSFEGGGHTGSGPRSGGLDGKGGFMAMLHPQEEVIDHYNRTKSTSDEEEDGKGKVFIEINQTFTGGVTAADLARASEETERRAFNAVTEAISRGGSYRKAVRR